MSYSIRKPLVKHDRFPTKIEGASLTDPSFVAECDINTILLRWQKTGVISHVSTYQGDYADFLDVPQDYQSAINQVMAADEAFASLPSSVRKRFGNDPAQFLQFVGDPDNIEAMTKMGLTKPPAEPDQLLEAVKALKPSEAPASAKKPSE